MVVLKLDLKGNDTDKILDSVKFILFLSSHRGLKSKLTFRLVKSFISLQITAEIRSLLSTKEDMNGTCGRFLSVFHLMSSNIGS